VSRNELRQIPCYRLGTLHQFPGTRGQCDALRNGRKVEQRQNSGVLEAQPARSCVELHLRLGAAESGGPLDSQFDQAAIPLEQFGVMLLG
jgi:hypothetical protein